MLASICMSIYNARESFPQVLASLECQKPDFDFEIVVVDDGSRERCQAACAPFPHVKYFYLGERPYYSNPSAGRNEAVRQSSGEVLICQSAEVVSHGNTIEQLVKAVLADPKTMVFAHVEESNGSADLCSPRNPRAFFFLGAIMRKEYYAVGGNDEEFTQPGFDDDWLADCLTHNGVKAVWLDDATGTHISHSRADQSPRGYQESANLYGLKRQSGNYKAAKSRLWDLTNPKS